MEIRPESSVNVCSVAGKSNKNPVVGVRYNKSCKICLLFPSDRDASRIRVLSLDRVLSLNRRRTVQKRLANFTCLT
eukprot:scaffold103026_cov47-Attheya_sp.AAC.1